MQGPCWRKKKLRFDPQTKRKTSRYQGFFASSLSFFSKTQRYPCYATFKCFLLLNLAKKSSLDNTLSLLLPIEQRQLSCWAAQKKKKLSLYHVSFFCFLFYSHFYSKATLFQPLLFFFTLYFSCAIVLKKKKKSNKQIKFIQVQCRLLVVFLSSLFCWLPFNTFGFSFDKNSSLLQKKNLLISSFKTKKNLLITRLPKKKLFW